MKVRIIIHRCGWKIICTEEQMQVVMEKNDTSYDTLYLSLWTFHYAVNREYLEYFLNYG